MFDYLSLQSSKNLFLSKSKDKFVNQQQTLIKSFCLWTKKQQVCCIIATTRQIYNKKRFVFLAVSRCVGHNPFKPSE